MGPIMTNGPIVEWLFVSNNNAKRYKETKDKDLLETIKHIEIQHIEKQDQ